MVNELEIIWYEVVVAYSRYYPNICLEGLKKVTEDAIKDSLCPGRDSNQMYPEYDSKSITAVPTCSVNGFQFEKSDHRMDKVSFHLSARFCGVVCIGAPASRLGAKLRVNLFLVTSSGKITQNNVLYENSVFFLPHSALRWQLLKSNFDCWSGGLRREIYVGIFFR